MITRNVVGSVRSTRTIFNIRLKTSGAPVTAGTLAANGTNAGAAAGTGAVVDSGVFGVTIGLIFTRVVAYFSDWPFSLHFMPALVGFAVSVITGVFFGFYPARRAAALEPIVSLRGD